MTDSEVTSLIRGLSALEATVTTEFGHVNKRLESHSTDIRKLSGEVQSLNLCIAKKQAVNNYKDAQEEQMAEDKRDTKKFWRQAWFQVMVSLVVFLLGSEFGHSLFKLIQSLCKLCK
jgi:hypothetical protein